MNRKDDPYYDKVNYHMAGKWFRRWCVASQSFEPTGDMSKWPEDLRVREYPR